MELIRWEAREFDDHERGSSWYYLVGIGAVILVALSLWQENFLFAIFLAIATILLFVWSQKTSPVRVFTLTDKSVQIDSLKTIPYSDIKTFSLKEAPEDSHQGLLVLDIKEFFRPNAYIPVPQDKIGSVREELRKRLLEREHVDSLTDELLKILKF